MNEMIAIIDFGGQYSQVIARKVRECHVYCEVFSWQTAAEVITEKKPIGIILSGGPSSVYEDGAPAMDPVLLNGSIPVLGICYGCQLMMKLRGGLVVPAEENSAREYGRTLTLFNTDCPLFRDLPEEGITWMSHGDYVREIPAGFQTCAETEHCPSAGIWNEESRLYALQFHPEVHHTENGMSMLQRFLYDICGAKGDWTMKGFRAEAVKRIRNQVRDGHVLLGLSGGVDSAVCAALIHEAIGDRLVCLFVDHGMMRKDEGDEIETCWKKRGVNFHRADAGERFLSALKGVTDPEEKRHIIGALFARVFSEKAAALCRADYLAQGTIYPDVIESGAAGGAVIKSHHNVGGLPSDIGFQGLIEPLRILFKDEVRQLGRELGLPETFTDRQPFPGPGLAVRIIGEITEEKLRMLREADAIFRQVLEEDGAAASYSQYFAVLTDTRTVGVMGDARTYQYTAALRAVCTEDFMTADFARIPWPLLEKTASRIVNEVPGINRLVYDITSKPPATVEWE